MSHFAWSMLLVFLVGAGLRPRPVARRPVPVTTGVAVTSTSAPSTRRRTRWPRRPTGARRTVSAAEAAAWCDRLARAVRGGSSLTAAIVEVEPPARGGAVIDRVRLSLERGSPLGDALELEPTGSDNLDLAVLVLRACARHGGPPGEPIDRAATALRARAAASDDRRTQSAQARLSATVMTLLPLAMLLILIATSGSVRQTLTTPIGAIAVTAGLTLNAIGWRWMRAIVGGHVR